MKYKGFQSINNYHSVSVFVQGKNAYINVNINIEEVKSFILLMAEVHEFIKLEEIHKIIYENFDNFEEFNDFNTFFNYILSLHDIKKL